MRSRQPYLSIIIPVHNEERRLEESLYRLHRWLMAQSLSYEIIAIDNGSTDRTPDILFRHSQTFNHFNFEIFAMRGKGLAVRHGMLMARGHYRYMCDADLSTPLHEIRRFLEKALKYDVVIGSRELDPVQVISTRKRRFIGRAFHLLTGAIVPGIADTQCGFKMFRDYAADAIFSKTKIDGLAFDVEALWLARQLGYSVCELPVTWKHDPDSRVRLVDDSLQMAWDVLWLKFAHLRMTRRVART